MSEEKGLTERMKDLEENIKLMLSTTKNKKFRMLTKGLIGRARLRKGYIIVVTINDNGAVVFDKQPIIDGTVKLGDTFHAVSKEDILTYKNKPLIILAKKSLNPINPLNEDNETYGQKYVMARMINEAIKEKKKLGAIGWWILGIGAIGFIAYQFLGKGGV